MRFLIYVKQVTALHKTWKFYLHAIVDFAWTWLMSESRDRASFQLVNVKVNHIMPGVPTSRYSSLTIH
jgi:hypothetical protein